MYFFSPHSYNLPIILYFKKETTIIYEGCPSNRTIFFKRLNTNGKHPNTYFKETWFPCTVSTYNLSATYIAKKAILKEIFLDRSLFHSSIILCEIHPAAWDSQTHKYPLVKHSKVPLKHSGNQWCLLWGSPSNE